MEIRKLGAVEQHFADRIWEYAPISSGELVKLCAEKLEWKKSTTYTVLKRLCEEGLFENRDGMVCVKLSRQNYAAAQSRRFAEENFEGSLPAFLAAFTARKSLSEKEIAEIRQMIEAMGGK